MGWTWRLAGSLGYQGIVIAAAIVAGERLTVDLFVASPAVAVGIGSVTTSRTRCRLSPL